MRYVPTKEDIERIKEAAFSEAAPYVSPGAILLEPGIRVGPKGSAMNPLLVSDDPLWNDTDLEDYGTWAEFRKGVELTEDGRGAVDFYIRKRNDPYNSLHGNVTIDIRDGKLVRIYGYPNVYYKAPDERQ